MFTKYQKFYATFAMLCITEPQTAAFPQNTREMELNEPSRSNYFWRSDPLPPLKMNAVAAQLFEALIYRYGKNEPHSIAGALLAITADLGRFCVLPPEQRSLIESLAYARYTREKLDEINIFIEKCGLIIYKITNKSDIKFLVYFSSSDNSIDSDLHVTRGIYHLKLVPLDYKNADPALLTISREMLLRETKGSSPAE